MQLPQSFRAFLARELRGKLRVWLSWIIVPLILWNVWRTPAPFGVAIVLLGTALRFWASGCLRKEGRLCVVGPYRFTRNPLYLGSILISIGIPISQNAWWLTAFVYIACLLMFYPLITTEEGVLVGKFGQPYQNYLLAVPRLFSPLIFAREIFRFRGRDPENRFDWALWKKNKGWEPLLVGASILLVSFLMPKVWRAVGQRQAATSLRAPVAEMKVAGGNANRPLPTAPRN